MTRTHKSSNLRAHRRAEGAGLWHVIKKTKNRQQTLIVEEGQGQMPAEIVVATLGHAVKTEKIHLAAFVVMPDHWHGLFALGSSYNNQHKVSLSRQMKIMNSWISRNSMVNWQDGYYETRIRSAKQFKFVINYIENNPIRAGYANSITEWKWSSGNPQFSEFLTRPWPWQFEWSD